jgi:hypothetical protein
VRRSFRARASSGNAHIIVSAVFVLLSQFALSFTFNILRFSPPITPFFSFPILCFILLHTPLAAAALTVVRVQCGQTTGTSHWWQVLALDR